MSSQPIQIAPDGSNIRVLVRTAQASVIHCSLAAGAVSRAVRHASVEEIWYCLCGSGRLWRRDATGERTDALRARTIFTLSAGTCFQFRNDGSETLELLITTMPPWPSDDEASRCDGYWAPQI